MMTFNQFTNDISVNFPMDAMTPQAKMDMLYALLRNTGLAYQPGLKDAMEKIQVYRDNYLDPLNPKWLAPVVELNKAAYEEDRIDPRAPDGYATND